MGYGAEVGRSGSNVIGVGLFGLVKWYERW